MKTRVYTQVGDSTCGICVKGRGQPWALFAPQDTFHMFFYTGSYVGFEFINWAKLAGQEALAILLCRSPQCWDYTTMHAMPGSFFFFFSKRWVLGIELKSSW